MSLSMSLSMPLSITWPRSWSWPAAASSMTAPAVRVTVRAVTIRPSVHLVVVWIGVWVDARGKCDWLNDGRLLWLFVRGGYLGCLVNTLIIDKTTSTSRGRNCGDAETDCELFVIH